MSVKLLMAQVTVVSVPLSNEVTDNGIINALDLEMMVWLGLTYGAWFKIIGLVSILLMIALNLQVVWMNCRRHRRFNRYDSRKSPKKVRKR